MPNIEAADRGLWIHGTILCECDANSAIIDEPSQGENLFLVGQERIPHCWTNAVPSSRLKLALQVFAGGFNQDVAYGL